MVNSHKDLIEQLKPRIDKKTLDPWKVEMNGKTTVLGRTGAILPDRSDNPTTMRVNQFAADIYPDRIRPLGGCQGAGELAQEARHEAVRRRRGIPRPSGISHQVEEIAI